MSRSRRRFLTQCLAAPLLTWGCRRESDSAPTTPPSDAPGEGAAPPPGPTRTLLVLGGTRFLGPAVVEEARAAGLEVTLFNRGKSNPEAFPKLETLIGDRDPEVGAGLSALRDRQWDAVIDTSGYFPRMVKASAELLAPVVGHYVFVSSVSAYASHQQPDALEDAPLAELEDPTVETMGDQFQHYGGLKVLCEQAAEAAMPGRVANVRPGYIVGPRDPTDRFTYWPWRMAQGGTMLAPGSAEDPVQIIDVRDLGRWLVQLVVDRTPGVLNAVGPRVPSTMGEVLRACRQATGSEAELRWAGAEFLKGQAEAKALPGLPIPIWAPPTGETAGFHRRSNARAVEAGLTFRSVQQTAADTWAWFQSLPEARRAKPRAGIPPALEQELLAALAAGKAA